MEIGRTLFGVIRKLETLNVFDDGCKEIMTKGIKE